MPCDDRQLTQAQREAGFENQRTGVTRGIRPFTGEATPENLVDYLNREVFPLLKAAREKINDTYLRVMDNAPSANPLGYYFSTTTTNADPTAGRIRLDAATQNTATTIRVSESNAQLVSAASWLDVMAGSSTEPLGTVTLSDAVNPGRFLRFDLESMTDQGAYWDLSVTVIESSHDNPFVEDGAVVLGFIPGVASELNGGATVPATSMSDAPEGTFLANLFDEGDETPRWFSIDGAFGDGLTYDPNIQADGAPFPSTASEHDDSNAVATTSHAITMPAVRLPGDRIVIAMRSSALNAGASALSVPADWRYLDGESTATDGVGAIDVIEMVIAADGSNDPGDSLTVSLGSTSAALLAHVWLIRDSHPTEIGRARQASSATSLSSRDVGLLVSPWRESNIWWGCFVGYNNNAVTVTDFPDDFTDGQGQTTLTLSSHNMGIGYGSRQLRADRMDATSFSFGASPRSAAFTIAVPPRETGQISLTASAAVPAETFVGNLFDYAAAARAWDWSEFADVGLTVTTAVANGPFPEPDDDDTLTFTFDVAATSHNVTMPNCEPGQAVLMFVSVGGTASVTTPTERPWQSLGSGLGSSHRLAVFYIAPDDMTTAVSEQVDEIEIALGASNGIIVRIIPIDDAHPTQLPTLSSFSVQNGTTSTTTNDIGSVTPVPGDSSAQANYLYLSVLSTATEDSIVTGFPSNYTNTGQVFVSSTNGNIDNSLAFCERQVRGSSEDIGAYTYDSSGNGRSIGVNVAIIPASAITLNWDGVGVLESGASVGTRRNLNLVSGTKTTPNGTDDSANDEVEIQFNWDGLEIWDTSGVDQGDFIILQFADTTSILTDGGSFSGGRWQARFQRAALTGAIAASQNSNSTTFAGIRDNGSSENDRANLNFVAGTNTTVAITDDAGNDELEIAVSVDNFPLTGLADQADDTFLANISGGAAPPTAVALTTLAGAGLTGGANAVLAVGAGDGIDVNADDVAVDVTDIVDNVSITEVATNNIQRAALTGAISASAGSNSTLFSGITDNGVSEADRATLDFVNSTTNTALITDTGSVLQIEYRRAALTGFAAASANSNATTSAEPIVTYSSSANMSAERVTTSSTSITVSTSVASQIEFQRAALTGAITASANSNTTAYGAIAALGVVANGTNASAVPTTIQAGANDRVFRRVSDVLDWGVLTAGMFPANVISNTMIRDCSAHTLIGNASESTADPADVTQPGLARILYTPTSGAGAHTICWEDQDFKLSVDGDGGTVSVSVASHASIFASTTGMNGNWFVTAGGNTGTFAGQTSDPVGHNGVLIVTNGSASGDAMVLYHSRDSYTSVGGGGNGETNFDFDDFEGFDFYVMLPTVTSVQFRVGVGTNITSAGLGTDSCYFELDAPTDTTFHVFTRASSVSTDTDTGFTAVAGSWVKLSAFRSDSNTIEFYINNALEASHSTNIPTANMYAGIRIANNSASARAFHVDRVRIFLDDQALIG